MLDKIDIDVLIDTATEAGEEIMNIYRQPFEVESKADDSPLTRADKKSNEIIIKRLQDKYPQIPVISEETKQTPYAQRKDWSYFWLIDPLDGTKEFIKKNDEFTVNIALIHDQVPEIGVVYLPAKDVLYFSVKNEGAFKINEEGESNRIHARKLESKDKIVIMGSRSHANQELTDFVEQKKKEYREVEFIAAGSALKITYVAEGKADIYPRLGPTMEWDTGAGHAIAIESGKQVLEYKTGQPLKYNKEDLLNPWFIVK